SAVANWGERIYALVRGTRHASATPQYDCNIMLEHVWPQFRHNARMNIVVPNPEFFDNHDVSWLRCIDHIWAKTENTKQIFAQFNVPITTIGFDSEDRYDSSVSRDNSFFHL